VRQGNSPPRPDPGLKKTGGRGLKGTARRSTGISPESRDPITPDAPNLSPA
jgi:ribosomal protein L15